MCNKPALAFYKTSSEKGKDIYVGRIWWYVFTPGNRLPMKAIKQEDGPWDWKAERLGTEKKEQKDAEVIIYLLGKYEGGLGGSVLLSEGMMWGCRWRRDSVSPSVGVSFWILSTRCLDGSNKLMASYYGDWNKFLPRSDRIRTLSVSSFYALSVCWTHEIALQ